MNFQNNSQFVVKNITILPVCDFVAYKNMAITRTNGVQGDEEDTNGGCGSGCGC